MAKALIDSLTSDFDADQYRDEYREELLALIERKAKGEKIVAPAAEAPKPTKAPDLMAALEESLAAVKGEEAKSSSSGAKAKPQEVDLEVGLELQAFLKPIAKQGKGRQVEVDGRELALTNLDKVLWPARRGGRGGSRSAFTKGEAIDYYARIADTILPHLAGRPLTRVRFPDGVEGQRFFEKRAPKHTPDWVRTAPIEMGSVGRARLHRLRRPPDPGLARTARRARAPPVACAREEARAADRARLRPRPGRAGDGRRVRAGGAAPARAVREPRPRVLPQALGLEGDPGLRAAQHRGHLRPDEVLRPRRRPGAGELRARPRRLEAGPQAAQGQGARRLEPERLLEDHGRRLLAALPAPALGVDAADLGRGRRARRRRRSRTPCASRRRRRSSGSPRRATCSPPCSSSSRSSPRCRERVRIAT